MKKTPKPIMTPHVKKLQAALDADPEAKARIEEFSRSARAKFQEMERPKTKGEEKFREIMAEMARESSEAKRRMRPTILKMRAHWESLFPPESPTSKRRGGNKLAPSQEFIHAVCAILDAKMGNDFHIYGLEEAMKSADPKFFAMLAEAAQYVRDMPQGRAVFAKHVIAARRIAADMMGASGPLPSKAKVKAAVLKQLVQEAYGAASPEWSRVWAAAGLKDLPR